MAESISLINPPHIEFTSNNSGKNKDIRCLNYRFQLKSIGKLAACFRCSGIKGSKCYATLSLKTKIIRTDGVDKPTIIEPFEISNLNWKHVDGCLPKYDDHFITKSFMQHVKSEVVKNPLVSTQQLYETERQKQVANRAENEDVPVTMPDYTSIKDCLIRKRGKTQSATNILDVEVKDTLTSDKQPFLIFDNKKLMLPCSIVVRASDYVL